MAKLGVNIDHVATLRQARGERYPDPVRAAVICEESGADSIVAHLREDRRHINEKDVMALRKTLRKRFNLEMAISAEIVDIALRVKPDCVTLVPERRQELTTEGGLDVVAAYARLRRVVRQFEAKGIEVSLFVDPVKAQILKAKAVGAPVIELHTGRYAAARTAEARRRELKKISDMVIFAGEIGLVVSAGHGLHYQNTAPVARIPGLYELNIGHSIVSESVYVGLPKAVREMKRLIRASIKK